MNGKRARAIRKLCGLKLPIKADMRISKKVEKMEYFTKPITGVQEARVVEKTCLVNASKYSYRRLKKNLVNVNLNPQKAG